MQNLLNPNILKLKSKGIESVKSRVINLKEISPSLTYQDLVLAISESFIDYHKNEFDVISHAQDIFKDSISTQREDYHNLIQKDLFFNKQKNGELPERLILNDNIENDSMKEFLGNQNNNHIKLADIHPSTFDNELLMELWSKMASKDWILGESPQFSNNFEFKNDAGFFDVYFESSKGKITSFMIFSDCLYTEFIENLENVFDSNNQIECGKSGIEKAHHIFNTTIKENPTMNNLGNHFFADFIKCFE